jgi:hypothetical protein
MNPDQIINFNQNAAQCIHNASYFGKDVYYNICAHTQTEVPWGGADWAWWILGYCSVIAIVVGFAILVIHLVRE